MARTPTIPIHVQDEQFKAFVKSFQDLANKMKDMTDKWKELGGEIDKTAQVSQHITTSMKSVSEHVSAVNKTAKSISKHFSKWTALVGGISALLGGGTLFGMDRIANRIMELRKFTLGLGGADAGKTQATQVFGKGMLDDPTGMLQKIRRGKYAGTDQYLLMQRAGIKPEEIDKDPNAVLIKLMEKMAEEEKGKSEVGRYLRMQQGGWTSVFGEADIERNLGAGGKDFREMLRKRQEAARGLTPQDLDAWEKFWESVKNYQVKIDTEFTKMLTPAAGAMTKVIEGFTALTAALLESKAASVPFTLLTKALTLFSGLIDTINKLLGDKFKDYRPDPRSPFGRLYDRIQGNPPPAPLSGTSAAPAQPGQPATAAPATPAQPSIYERAKSLYESAQKALKTPLMQTPATMPGTVPGTQGGQPGLGASVVPYMGAGGLPTAPAGGGGSSSGFLPPAPSYPGLPSGAAPGGALPEPAPAPFNFHTQVNSAVQRMAPPKGSLAKSLTENLTAPDGALSQMMQRGALDANNWQSNRTASLTIRGVPSANLFVAATGMASSS